MPYKFKPNPWFLDLVPMPRAQRQVLEKICEGRGTAEVARELGIRRMTCYHYLVRAVRNCMNYGRNNPHWLPWAVAYRQQVRALRGKY